MQSLPATSIAATGGALRGGSVAGLLDGPADPPQSSRFSDATATPDTYRTDIDGLRAVAVLAVLFFHLGVPGFSGGFLGVDVFFVISGFLITRIIEADISAGRFSLAHFYARRARRLLPAFFVMLAISSVAGFLLLAPQHLKSFAHSLLAANSAFQISCFGGRRATSISRHE